MVRTRGRRPGGRDTRTSIVAEARRQFGETGYAGTTLRSVAAGAGVDPRLVLHYFGSKQGLFQAAVELPIQPEAVLAAIIRPGVADDGQIGRRAAQFLVSTLEDADRRLVLIGLLRAAVEDPEAAEAIRDLLAERILLPVARAVAADRPELRASLAATQVVGLTIVRHVVRMPALAAATPEDLVLALAPVLQHFLAEPWSAPGPDNRPEPT